MANYFQVRRPALAGLARTGLSPATPARRPDGRSRRNPVPPDSVLPGAGLANPQPPSPGPASPVRTTAGPARRGGFRLTSVVPVVALLIADMLALALAGASTSGGLLAALYGLVALTALWLGGLHRLRICLRVSDQIGRILAATVLPVVLLLPLLPADGAVRFALLSAGLVIAFRLVTCSCLRAAHRLGLLTEPTLVVGAGTFGAHLAEQIRLHPELGLRVSGFLDSGAPRRDLPEPSLGRPEDLAQVVAALGIRRVIVCYGDWRDEDLIAILRACRPLRADVCVVPRLHELGLAVPRGCLDEIWGIPLIPLRRIGAGPASLGLKRIFDVSVAAVMLAAALPVLLVLAAVIRLQTGQSPLFRQLRVTGDGRQASVLKLRTITDSSDADTTWAVDRERYSRLGGWLRATHLDELPQLVNVLRGEMSLVGPRPERPHFAGQFAREIPRYGDRDRMRAGLTGWAQVHGLHGDTSITERSRFDNQYIEYWSPWLDMVILARTVGSALSGLGAGR
jgi:exopolysaccharide biosynthesis polyprenyl glycosylphosphotransferase